MFPIDTSTAVPTRPAPGASGSAGYFTGGDPGATPPVAPTFLDPDWLNRMQVELLTLILGAALTPSKADSTQVLQAVLALIAAWSGKVKTYAGDPNGHVAGAAGAAGDVPPTLCVDLTTGDLWVCFASGTATTTQWRKAPSLATLAEARGGTTTAKSVTPASAATIAQTSAYTYAAAGGTANALTVALTPGPGSLTLGMELEVLVATSNTGPATISVNGLAPVAIVSALGDPLVPGQLRGARLVRMAFDGASFQLTSNYPPDFGIDPLTYFLGSH